MKYCTNYFSMSFYVISIFFLNTAFLSGYAVGQTPEELAKPTEQISIKAPSYVEKPSAAPFSVDLDPPLKDGDTLTFCIDGHLAYSVKPTGGVLVSFLSGKVRSFKGVVNAEVVRSNGTKNSKQFSFRQDGVSHVPDVEDHNTKYIERAAPG
jgi:hypothetical protein